jgi:hypothetical protein
MVGKHASVAAGIIDIRIPTQPRFTSVQFDLPYIWSFMFSLQQVFITQFLLNAFCP